MAKERGARSKVFAKGDDDILAAKAKKHGIVVASLPSPPASPRFEEASSPRAAEESRAEAKGGEDAAAVATVPAPPPTLRTLTQSAATVLPHGAMPVSPEEKIVVSSSTLLTPPGSPSQLKNAPIPAPVTSPAAAPAVAKPASASVPSSALIGLSLLGNLDGVYAHATFPALELHTLTTGSRQRQGGMLLFGYSFAGKMWISLGWDVNGFEEGVVQEFWARVLSGVDEFLLEA